MNQEKTKPIKKWAANILIDHFFFFFFFFVSTMKGLLGSSLLGNMFSGGSLEFS